MHVSRLLLQKFNYLHCRVVGGGTLVVEDNYLLAHAKDSHKVVKDDIIHDIVTSLSTTHLFHSVKAAFQRRRSIAGVEAESSLLVSVEEVCDVEVVRQSGRQTYEPDGLLVLEASCQGA